MWTGLLPVVLPTSIDQSTSRPSQQPAIDQFRSNCVRSMQQSEGSAPAPLPCGGRNDDGSCGATGGPMSSETTTAAVAVVPAASVDAEEAQEDEAWLLGEVKALAGRLAVGAVLRPRAVALLAEAEREAETSVDGGGLGCDGCVCVYRSSIDGGPRLYWAIADLNEPRTLPNAQATPRAGGCRR